MPQQIIVDRIEGNLAVCETGDAILHISLTDIDGDIRDGVVLKELNDGKYTVDLKSTTERRDRAEKHFKRQKMIGYSR